MTYHKTLQYITFRSFGVKASMVSGWKFELVLSFSLNTFISVFPCSDDLEKVLTARHN